MTSWSVVSEFAHVNKWAFVATRQQMGHVTSRDIYEQRTRPYQLPLKCALARKCERSAKADDATAAPTMTAR